jgi:hypothetical protein
MIAAPERPESRHFEKKKKKKKKKGKEKNDVGKEIDNYILFENK